MSEWKPDDKQKRAVRQWASIGMSLSEIARLLDCGLSEKSLLSACRQEIALGKTQAKASLRGKLFTEAAAGKAPALLHLVKERSEEPALVTTAELASWLCCTRETISDLARRGIIEKAERGSWDIKQCVQRCTTHLRAIAAGRAGGDGGDIDLTMERALLARAQRESVEMDNDVTRGLLMRRETVVDLFGRLNHAVVRELATLPDRVERDLRVDAAVSEYVRQTVRELREDITSAIDGLRSQH